SLDMHFNYRWIATQHDLVQGISSVNIRRCGYGFRRSFGIANYCRMSIVAKVKEKRAEVKAHLVCQPRMDDDDLRKFFCPLTIICGMMYVLVQSDATKTEDATRKVYGHKNPISENDSILVTGPNRYIFSTGLWGCGTGSNIEVTLAEIQIFVYLCRKIVGGHIMTSSHIFKGLVLPCTLVVSFPAGYMVFLLVAHCYYWSLVVTPGCMSVTAGSSRFVLALQTVSIGCVTFLLVVCAG
ncbi:hypothetical protein Tco_0402095, partial [Tanacetum coccineum]